MNIKDIDLDSKAFGDNGEISPDEEKGVEVKETVASPTEQTGDVEENRIPYSRFEKIHQRALEAEQEAEQWRAKAEELSRKPFEEPKEIPSYWTELYGDSEPARKAWEIEQRRIASIKEEARREAIEAVREDRINEQRHIEQNVDRIDSRLESLQEYLKRPLTDQEESKLLDIVDEFTPKDEDGNYLGDTISFDKAWQIYEMQQTQSTASSRKSRNNVLNVTGRQSQGEPGGEENTELPRWGSWRNKI